MTRRAITVTVYGQRVTCDRCGVALYVSRRAVDRWLRGLGWAVANDKDLCPGCAGEVARNGKESVDWGADV